MDLFMYASGQVFADFGCGVGAGVVWKESVLKGQAINCVVKRTAKFPAATFKISAATQFR